MKPLRVGVIGARFGAQVHVPAFRRDPRCLVTAIAGRNRTELQRIAAGADVADIYTDWRELVASPLIDVVTVAVPPALQPEIIRAAASARKHVFCEKPLGATSAETEAAVAAAEQAGIVHGIDFLFPEIPVWRQLRELLGAGGIGQARHFAYTWRVETYASRTNADTWKNRNGDGGGVLGNFVSHVYHNLEWLLGPVAAVEGFSRGPWGLDCSVRLDDGTAGSLSICTDAFLGAGHRLEIYGTEGTAVLHNPTADYAAGFQLWAGTRTQPRLTLLAGEDPVGGVDGRIAPVARLAGRLIDAIQGAGPMSPNLHHGLRVQQLLARTAANLRDTRGSG